MYNYALFWDDIMKACKDVAGQIKQAGTKYDGILAIARGGMIPAVIIAGILGIRTIKTYQVKRYTNKQPDNAIGETPFDLPGRWLIVDDIMASGETLNLVRKIFPHTDAAILCTRRDIGQMKLVGTGNFFFGRLVKDDEAWIVFPWETVRKDDGE